MAMGKNKTGIMAAITAAGAGEAQRAHPALPRGTIGSVRAGLGGIQEIDTDLILPWGPKDRMEVELTAVNTDTVADLAESIRENGQQVPVLLRPASTIDGRFEVIYGRRRILACQSIGLPVKALIRTLNDAQALKAKGLENAERVELSYYERARFAQAILDQGFNRQIAQQALSISKATLSQLERITRLVPREIGDAIGPAPGAGRPKWMKLAETLEKAPDSVALIQKVLAQAQGMPSDDRLDAVLQGLTRRGARAGEATTSEPLAGITVKQSRSTLSLTVKRAGPSKAFADWLADHLDEVIQDSFDRFQQETPAEKSAG